MLLRFSTENYKMFVGRATLSMEAAPKQKGLDYSLIRERLAGKERKGVCTAVVYGPNAAGKSALIAAMKDMRDIVLRGSVSAEGGGRDLSLAPTSFAEHAMPVLFSTAFSSGGRLYEYGLEADLGRFAHPEDVRQVVSERLAVDGSEVFRREGGSVSVGVPTHLGAIFSRAYLDNRGAADAILGGVEREDLFLTNGFRTIVSPTIAKAVISWFSKGLMIVPRANDTSVYPRDGSASDSDILGAHFSEAARVLGASARDTLVFRRGDEVEEAVLYTAVDTPSGRVAVPSQVYESFGTTRFLNMLPFVEMALADGRTFVMDELDASIHPMAIMSIVNAFHDDGVNTKGAQLVFTTHNPIFLDKNLLRRDEIKFVERDDQTGESVTYALSDFGTSGSQGVRQGEDYQRGYFMGRYGGIREVDIVPFLKEQLERGIHMDLTAEGSESSAEEEASADPKVVM